MNQTLISIVGDGGSHILAKMWCLITVNMICLSARMRRREEDEEMESSIFCLEGT